MKHRIRDAIILRTGTVPARNKSLRKGQGGGGESRPLALFPETDRAILALIASRHCTAFPSVLLAHSGIVHIVLLVSARCRFGRKPWKNLSD